MLIAISIGRVVLVRRHLNPTLSFTAALKKYMANKPQDLESLVIQVSTFECIRILCGQTFRLGAQTNSVSCHDNATLADAARHPLPDAHGAVRGSHRFQKSRLRKHQKRNNRGFSLFTCIFAHILIVDRENVACCFLDLFMMIMMMTM